MKKIFLSAILVCIASTAFAQQQIQDRFEVVGNLIQATLYHDNGTVAQTGFYTKQNKLHGKWVSYGANGTKTAVANYKNGTKVGTWVFYQGDTMKEVTYTASKIAAVKTWAIKDYRVVSNRP
ncbi:MAG: toxin-antitoxin system YwqK family antitoxin [Marinirhabdus sp.]